MALFTQVYSRCSFGSDEAIKESLIFMWANVWASRVPSYGGLACAAFQSLFFKS